MNSLIFLLILCRFYIMHLDPTYLPVSTHLPSALVTSPKSKPNLKNQTKQRNKSTEKNPVVEAVVWPNEWHSLLFSPFIFTFKCSPSQVIALQTLVSAISLIMSSHWGSSWMSCSPVLWRVCCFGCVGLSLSHFPTVHRFHGC